MTRIAQDVIVTVRTDIFDKLQKLPFTYFDTRTHGKILIRVVNYVNSLSDLLSNGIIQFAADLFSILFIIAHRIASVVNADLVLVVEDGRITDRGTHAELSKP